MSPPIALRLKALRENRGLSQEELARAMGFKDRQTLSAIETGERKLSAEELLAAVATLNFSLEDFTDPFRLVGEGKFSWRQTGIPAANLNRYETSAGRWIAAFRTIAPEVGRQPPLLRPALALLKQSSFEEAAAAGERFAREFALGDVPAARLAAVMEERLGILVLMVNALKGISGAACRLPEIDVVLINRHETAGRRHFDLAHELFHILTWEAMPPEHVEEATETGGGKVEQLANAFASALLMPGASLDASGKWLGTSIPALVKRFNSTADALQVTSSALMWRLVQLGRVDRKVAHAIPASALRHNGRKKAAKSDPPPLFSKAFVEVLARALEQGRVSARRAADLLDLTLDDLSDLLAGYGVKAPFDL